MSYTQSFVGETEFDRQALNLDPGQAGVPLWKIYDPRSVGLPSNLRYDLSGLGNFGRGGKLLSMNLEQAAKDCAQHSDEHAIAMNTPPGLPKTPSYLLARIAERMRTRCLHYKSLKDAADKGVSPDPSWAWEGRSDDTPPSDGGLPKWALPAAIAVAAVVVVGFVL